jgi:hypothetical protein
VIAKRSAKLRTENRNTDDFGRGMCQPSYE